VRSAARWKWEGGRAGVFGQLDLLRRRPSSAAPLSLLCSAADADAAACVRDKVERERGWGLVPREEGHVFFPGKNEGDRQGIDRGGIPGGFNRTQKKPGLNPRESDPC
jgi:hypothetical protein